MSYIIAVATRWTKSVKFTLLIAVHRSGLGKNHFWLVAKQKKTRIGEQLNYFWNICSKSFSWAKIKRKYFSDGKSRGPLLARAALKTDHDRLLTKSIAKFIVLKKHCVIFGPQLIFVEKKKKNAALVFTASQPEWKELFSQPATWKILRRTIKESFFWLANYELLSITSQQDIITV